MKKSWFKTSLMQGSIAPALLSAMIGAAAAADASSLPSAEPNDLVQIAGCNPCTTEKNPCNPCAAAAENPCNPCAAAKNPCNPCAAAKNPCNPCAATKNPCNPCAAN